MTGDAAGSEARFFDGRTGTAHTVLARLQGGILILSAPDGALVAAWAAAEIERCDGNQAGTTATLRRHGAPERLVLQDKPLLAALRQAGTRMAEPSALARQPWLALAAGLLGALIVAAILVDRLPGLAAPFVPHRLEHAWSSEIEAVLSTSTTVCDNAAGTAALNRLFGRLSAGAGLAAPPEFEVLDGQLVNAFTLPDGRIIILRGLITMAQDPDELAGVIGHELGHVKHRDPTREMLRRVALNMTARSLGWGGGIATTMTALSYGRRAEAAADASAIETLHKAGLRADGLGRFFDLLQRRVGDGGVPAYLSDHPATSDRAARLRQPPTGEIAMSADEWAAVRGICTP